ncbi:hypothetical protein GCM10009792_25220 [Microcella alkalica]|uniref:Uncharacterized protein n=1 Tax=Microcella alkalica TaxID=355930 RepID=A0A839E2E7_9MICO|nr:hypothetical protein [Microcella alkalica]MBA8846839.1 hypothetical protein [Microcella alkalica]
MPARHSVGLPALTLLAVVTVFVTGIIVSEEGRGGALPGILIPVAIALLIRIGICVWRSPLTVEGSELPDHIRGLEQYIELAEAERMRVLQLPQGALRDQAEVEDRDEALRVTERLLPRVIRRGRGRRRRRRGLSAAISAG